MEREILCVEQLYYAHRSEGIAVMPETVLYYYSQTRGGSLSPVEVVGYSHARNRALATIHEQKPLAKRIHLYVVGYVTSDLLYLGEYKWGGWSRVRNDE